MFKHVFVMPLHKILAGFLSTEYGPEAAYYTSSAFVLSGSLALFAIDLRKYFLSRSHSHKHKHRRKARPEGGNRPRTPRVASEPNTDGTAGAIDGELGQVGTEGIEAQPDDDEEEDVCPPSCKACHLQKILNPLIIIKGLYFY